MKIHLSNLYILFACIILFSNCDDAEIIPREYPFIVMKEADLTETGALFRAEVMNVGSHTVQSYGFIWSPSKQNIDNADTTLISMPFTKGIFEKKINYGLVGGLYYSVRPFAIFDSTIVYGNEITFESLGSQKNPWSLLNPENSDLDGHWSSFGSAMNGNGFVLFGSSDFYSYDPVENSFVRSRNFPLIGGSPTRFTPVTLDKAQYYFNNIDNNLYKYENDMWTNQNKLPFWYEGFSGYYQGLSNDNSIMILSSSRSYQYNISTNSWIARSPIPISTGYSVGGTSIGSKAYVLTNDKSIWEYDSDSNTWNLITEYPGILKDKIISFSLNGKIYFGLSYYDYYEESNWLDNKLWSFDLTQEKWKLEEPIPLDIESGNLHYFFVNNMLYIGHRTRSYDLWKFDPTKN